jgi:hypothetical protein
MNKNNEDLEEKKKIEKILDSIINFGEYLKKGDEAYNEIFDIFSCKKKKIFKIEDIIKNNENFTEQNFLKKLNLILRKETVNNLIDNKLKTEQELKLKIEKNKEKKIEEKKEEKIEEKKEEKIEEKKEEKIEEKIKKIQDKNFELKIKEIEIRDFIVQINISLKDRNVNIMNIFTLFCKDKHFLNKIPVYNLLKEVSNDEDVENFIKKNPSIYIFEYIGYKTDYKYLILCGEVLDTESVLDTECRKKNYIIFLKRNKGLSFFIIFFNKKLLLF